MTDVTSELRRMITESRRAVVFTGAGISTESGIPDFRSPGGLWERFDPQVYANYRVFLKVPSKYWEMEREVTKIVQAADPNPAHKAIVKLEERGKLSAVITQNIDMLHQRAGTDSPIYELHGSAMTGTCVKCDALYKRQEILIKLEKSQVPFCDECGGAIKYDVVLFNEMLPYETITKAIKATKKSDCLIVVGSSLLVSPANQLPLIAKNAGAKLIVVNIEETPIDNVADIVLRGKAGKILPKIVNF